MMRGALVFSAFAAASATDLVCPKPTDAQLSGCLSNAVGLMGCCMWNQPENFFGSQYIVNVVNTFGEKAAEFAPLAPALTCDILVTNVAECAKQIKDIQVLALVAEASPELGAVPLAIACAVQCQNHTDSQAAVASRCSALPSLPQPGDPQSVFDCASTTGDEETTVEETTTPTTPEPSGDDMTTTDGMLSSGCPRAAAAGAGAAALLLAARLLA